MDARYEGSILWTGRLSARQQTQVRRGVANIRALAEAEEDAAEDNPKWQLAAAWDRGIAHRLPPVKSWQSEKDVMLEAFEGSLLCVRMEDGAGLSVMTKEHIPARAKVMVASGILVPVEAAQLPIEDEYTWAMPKGSSFALSQRELRWSNILRYINSSQGTDEEANGQIVWEVATDGRAGGKPWCPGVGVLCTTRDVEAGDYLHLPYGF